MCFAGADRPDALPVRIPEGGFHAALGAQAPHPTVQARWLRRFVLILGDRVPVNHTRKGGFPLPHRVGRRRMPNANEVSSRSFDDAFCLGAPDVVLATGPPEGF